MDINIVYNMNLSDIVSMLTIPSQYSYISITITCISIFTSHLIFTDIQMLSLKRCY